MRELRTASSKRSGGPNSSVWIRDQSSDATEAVPGSGGFVEEHQDILWELDLPRNWTADRIRLQAERRLSLTSGYGWAIESKPPIAYAGFQQEARSATQDAAPERCDTHRS